MTETGFHLKHHLTSFQIMILGFAGVILLGALVLMLPISAAGRVWTPFHEALFTSTSAVCVTGLVVLDTGSYWSAFGQTVILMLIQIGGLGVITAAVTFLMLSGKNISLKERSAMQDAISAPVVGGIVRLTRFILKGTFLVELVGALADGVHCRSAGQHRHYAADCYRRHRLSDMGRCLHAPATPAAVPDAEQGHSERNDHFDRTSGTDFLPDRLCRASHGGACFGIALSGGHAANGGL